MSQPIIHAACPVAITIRASLPRGEESQEWSWAEVAHLRIGDEIAVHGHGTLYSHSVAATVVHRDDHRVVVEEVEEYQEEGRAPYRTVRLHVLHLTPAMVSQSAPAKEGEAQAFAWAKENQGFAGTFADWSSQSAESRAAYENGAAGIPTA